MRLLAILFALSGCTFDVAHPQTPNNIHKLGSSIAYGGDLGGSTNTAQYVQSISGNAGGNGTVTMNSNTLKVVTSPFAVQDNGAVTRFSLETTHGRGTFGGGGSDYLGVIGPQAANETTGAAIYLLPNGTSPSGTNYSLASTSTDTYVQATAAGTLHLRLQSSGDIAQFNSTSIVSQVGLIQFGTGLSTGTLGTNKAGAGLLFQADAAANILQLYGGTQNSVALGSSIASVGHWRTSAGMQWLNRNSVNSADHLVIGDNGANELDIGSFALPFPQMRSAATALSLSSGTTTFGDGTGATVATWSLVSGGLSTIQLPGAITVTTRTITANLTVDTTTTDYEIIVDTSGGAVTVTLPTPTNGRQLVLVDKKNTFGTSNCTLARHATEKIDGVAASKVISSNGFRGNISSDGTDWYVK